MEWAVTNAFTANMCVGYSKRPGSDGVTLVGNVLHTTRNDRLHVAADAACQRRFLRSSTLGKAGRVALVFITALVFLVIVFKRTMRERCNFFCALLALAVLITRRIYAIGGWHVV